MKIKIIAIIIALLMTVVAGVSVYLYIDQAALVEDYETQIQATQTELQESLSLQRQQKNEITDLWADQAA